MLDKFREVKLRIYESVYHNKISDEDADVLLEMVEDIECIYEKKTREEYHRSKFLKKHNYNPEDSTIDSGDGKRIKFIDQTHMVNGKTDPRIPKNVSNLLNDKITGKNKLKGHPAASVRPSDKDSSAIVVDNPIWKLKNNKRIESIIQHELGHINKQHGPNNITLDYWDKIRNNIKQKFSNKSDDYIDKITTAFLNIDRDTVIKNSEKPETISRLNKRKQMEKYAKNTGHSSIDEIEADYSAIKNNGVNNFRKSLVNLNKLVRKNTKNKNNPKIKSALIDNENELNMRLKMSHDKNLLK